MLCKCKNCSLPRPPCPSFLWPPSPLPDTSPHPLSLLLQMRNTSGQTLHEQTEAKSLTAQALFCYIKSKWAWSGLLPFPSLFMQIHILLPLQTHSNSCTWVDHINPSIFRCEILSHGTNSYPVPTPKRPPPVSQGAVKGTGGIAVGLTFKSVEDTCSAIVGGCSFCGKLLEHTSSRWDYRNYPMQKDLWAMHEMSLLSSLFFLIKTVWDGGRQGRMNAFYSRVKFDPFSKSP